MKKIVVLLLIGTFCFAGLAFGADWSKYESGTNNVRVDGYQGQPGYINFTNGNGTNCGYLYADYDELVGDYRLIWVTPSSIDLNTTKLSDYYGVKLDMYD
jgi:hypothetical protein